MTNVRQWLFAVGVLSGALAGCATVFDGTGQTIVLDVTPVDADCTGWSQGELVGIYYPTFHTISVPRSRHDLTLLCSAYGYEDALVQLEPALGPWDVPASNGFDYLTGARHEYDQAVVIVMDKRHGEHHKTQD
jgi:hypothetical protein